MMSFDIFAIASFIGTVSFAASGFLIGVRKHLDLMGVFILAMLTANGGGAVRDILVNRLPTVLTDIMAFIIVIAVIALCSTLRLYKHPNIERHRLFILCDSIGLVAFSVTGALTGIDVGLSIFGVMVLAFITASGGGIIRDLMVNDVPTVLQSDFYGSIALLLGAAIYGLHVTENASNTTIFVALLIALTLRMVAHRYGWRLPRLKM